MRKLCNIENKFVQVQLSSSSSLSGDDNLIYKN